MAKKKRKRKSKLSCYIEYLVLLFVVTLIRILPLKVVLFLAKFLGYVLGHLTNLRKNIILKNLDIAFPEKDLKWKNEIRYKMYENILLSTFEGFKYGFLPKEKKLKLLNVDNNSKKLLEDLNNLDKSSLIVGGHYGFFEAGGHYATSIDLPATYIVENQRNKLAEKLLDSPRLNAGIKVIHRKEARVLLREVRSGKSFIALLSDQDAGRKAGVFIDFFGEKAATHKNAAVLALKYQLPLVFQITRRSKSDICKHDLFFQEISYNDISGSDLSFDEKVTELVKRYTGLLQEEINKDPAAYWWIHNRFKTKFRA